MKNEAKRKNTLLLCLMFACLLTGALAIVLSGYVLKGLIKAILYRNEEKATVEVMRRIWAVQIWIFLLEIVALLSKNHIHIISLNSNRELIFFTIFSATSGLGGLFYVLRLVSGSFFLKWPLLTILCILVIADLSGMMVLFVVQRNIERICQLQNAQERKEKDMIQGVQEQLNLYEGQRILVHDFRKQMMMVSSFAEKGEWESLVSYVRSIAGNLAWEEVSLSQNPILNRILLKYREECRNKSISFHCSSKEEIPFFLSYEETVALFGNLLENAVEAAEKSKDAYVDLSVHSRDTQGGEVLNVMLQNSAVQKPLIRGGQWLTSKAEWGRHGVGMRSIQTVLKRHNGRMEYCYDEEKKSLTIELTMLDKEKSVGDM